jgi:hypothetical protein
MSLPHVIFLQIGLQVSELVQHLFADLQVNKVALLPQFQQGVRAAVKDGAGGIFIHVLIFQLP